MIEFPVVIVTILHHLLSVLPTLSPTSQRSAFLFFDTLFAIGEATTLFLYSTQWSTEDVAPFHNPNLPGTSEGSRARFLSMIQALDLSVTFTIGLFLVLLQLVKIVVFIRSRRAQRQWDFSKDVIGDPPNVWWRHPLVPFVAIFGRNLWKSRVPGESKWLSVIRGLLSLTSTAIIISFSVHQLILVPLSEVGLTQRRKIYSSEISVADLWKDTAARSHWTTIVWIPWPALNRRNYSADVQYAWEFNDWDDIVCQNAEDLYGTLYIEDLPAVGQTCMSSGYNYSSGLHTLALQINYTNLGSLNGRQAKDVMNAARVYILLASNPSDAIVQTQPIYLLPGDNIVGQVDLVFQRRSKTSIQAMIGFERHDYFFTVEPVFIRERPSLAGQAEPNIARLTVGRRVLPLPFTFLEEFRDKSVIAALSGVGGLGSFLSTLSVLLVGTSLLRALFRMKDYSPFGLLHIRMGRQIQEKCREKFPALESDLDKFGRNPGVVAYLFTTLFDVEPLGWQDELVSGVGSEGEGNGARGQTSGEGTDMLEVVTPTIVA
ncbi:hypothetical protein NMY22_g7539 [Coprinellus aureogranulatus]|nr:hypothetical protein NMY22_g7539 [Coprinellus aureogranulatus]